MGNRPTGTANVVAGLLAMVLFMLYGFFLIYMRDLAPGREAWIAASNLTPHFEARLAHAHGNLFGVLNVVFGALLFLLPVRPRRGTLISWLALIGLAMPVGILSEIYLGLPPVLVLAGAVSLLVATALLGVEVVRIDPGDLPGPR